MPLYILSFMIHLSVIYDQSYVSTLYTYMKEKIVPIAQHM